MASPRKYSEIPSPSGGSFKTLGSEDATSTPGRTDSPAPARRASERSKLLNRSEDDGYVRYGAEQAERVERRRRSSSYAVINTGVPPGEGSGTTTGVDGDDVGEFSIFLVSYPQLPLTKGAHWVYAQLTYEDLRSLRLRGLPQGIGGSE